MSLLIKNKQSIAYKLLKVVFAIYFSLTFLITATHIAIEFFDGKSNIQKELSLLEKTFKDALTTAVWQLNDEQLDAIAQGILNLPIVTGFDYTNNHQKLQKSLGKTLATSERLFYHRFDISKEFGHKTIHLGHMRIYSDSSIIIDRVKLGFYLIVINACIKSTILTILFLWAFRRYLFQPLEQLTEQAEKINLNNLSYAYIDLGEQQNNELKELQDSINVMLKHIESDRVKFEQLQQQQKNVLEQQVHDRTIELQEANEQLNQLAYNDSLTKIKNRHSFFEVGNKLFSIAKRDQQCLAILLIDIDFFKKINDQYGHPIGDKVLVNFTQLISEQLRESDLFARIGGEEFAIVMNNGKLEGAKNLAGKLCQLIESSPLLIDDFTISYTISIGLAEIQDMDIGIDDLVKRADEALYQAKNNGRNQYQFFEKISFN